MNLQSSAYSPPLHYPMDTKTGGHLTRERERVPLSKKVAQKCQSLLGFSNKSSPRKNTSESSSPQTLYNQPPPGLAELPDSPWRPNYSAAHGLNYTDMRPAPPVMSTGYHIYPPQELGQQSPMILPEVILGTEIIIALMGVTGKTRCRSKPAYIG